MHITPFVITITSPNGGERLQPGSQHLIKWNSNKPGQSYKADYSTDGGSTWKPIFADANHTATSYLWTVPNDGSTNCKVRVTTFYGTDAVDASDAPFTIVPLVLTQKPAAGEQLAGGSTFDIKWLGSPAITGINLYYTSNGGSTWNTIATNLTNNGSFAWKVPTDIQSGNCKIRVQAANNLNWQDASEVFTIRPLVLTQKPAAGQQLVGGAFFTIKWVSQSSIGLVNLYYTTDGGSNWVSIANNVASSGGGSYSWKVPNTITSSNCKILVQAANNWNWFDDSKAFNILPAFQLLRPNGGEVFYAGQANRITWKPNGANYLNIYYLNRQNHWVRINDINYPIDSRLGYYDWYITDPNFSHPACRILLQDATYWDIHVIGAGTFTVKNIYGNVIPLSTVTASSSTPSSLQLYPNPALHQLTISADALSAQAVVLKVYSMTNPALPIKVINSIAVEKGKLNYTMDVSTLTPGLYIVEMISGNEKRTQKFEKQ
jgi:hypothetical protein